jgi:hypothetical protein
MTFATGVIGSAGAHDTTAGTLEIGGIAFPDFATLETPIVKFDLIELVASSADSLEFKSIMIDDSYTFDDQILVPIVDVA